MVLQIHKRVALSLLFFLSLSCSNRVTDQDKGTIHLKGSKFESGATVSSIQHEAVSSGASIVGNVYDRDSGEPISGASIFVENANRGSSTNTVGHFLIPAIPAGTYRITAKFIAYKPAFLDSVAVRDHDLITVTFRLAAGEVDLWY